LRNGFSLIEVLVAILLTGIAMAVFVRDFGFTVKTRREMDLVAETQQALHATHTFVAQELRQAGACLPENGEFISLAAANNGSVDTLTLRIGVADRTNLTCLTTLLTSDREAGDNTLEVQDTAGFEIDQWIYVTRTGGLGGTFRVTSVGADWLQIDGGLDADFVAGGGVYAIEERLYAVQTIGDLPVLTVSIDGGDPQPLVAGVEEFDVRYRLAPCPPCTETDEPVDSAEWRSVREVELRVVARSTAPRPQGGGYVRAEATTAVRPRNLL
jgi:prepilin-type N-terminal cleavage/methylation domain-containing protein